MVKSLPIQSIKSKPGLSTVFQFYMIQHGSKLFIELTELTDLKHNYFSFATVTSRIQPLKYNICFQIPLNVKEKIHSPSKFKCCKGIINIAPEYYSETKRCIVKFILRKKLISSCPFA